MADIEKLEIFYIRHGNTDPAKIIGKDDCDIDLSELGEKQCVLLGKRFEHASFDAVLCSPMVRAVKTAAGLVSFMRVKPTIEIVPEIIETGTIPGYTKVDLPFLMQFYPDLKMCEDHIFGDENGFAENHTDEQNDARASAVIRYLKQRFHYGQKVVLVSHGSFGGHFLSAGIEMGKGDRIISINNTSVSKLKYTSDGKKRLSFSNDFSHLRPLMPDYEFTV